MSFDTELIGATTDALRQRREHSAGERPARGCEQHVGTIEANRTEAGGGRRDPDAHQREELRQRLWQLTEAVECLLLQRQCVFPCRQCGDALVERQPPVDLFDVGLGDEGGDRQIDHHRAQLALLLVRKLLGLAMLV